ncbi:MAG: hypothetical protein ACLQGP_36300 [Isosphaeraceae bacterium]
MSITTPLETIPVPDAGPSASSSPSQDILARERGALGEILRLVADRAAAETEVEEARTSGDTTADAEYERARRNLQEKVERLEREGRTTDEQRRRSIVEGGMRGEAEAKDEFASSSRRIATDFDRGRESARHEASRAKSEIAAAFESAQIKAVQEHTAAVKPILDLVRMADQHRERLAALAADYAKFGLNPEPAIASEENYAKFEDPVDEVFNRLARMETPLKLLEGLIIPKSMKGGREAWVFVVVIGLMAGIGAVAGGGAAGIGGGVAAGAALAVLLRVWLVKLSRNQLERLYLPLKQDLADADNLAAYARGIVDDRLKDARQQLAARRDEDLKRNEANHARLLRAAEAQRDERLRRINEVYASRMVEVQTTQQRDLREAIDAYDRHVAELQAQAKAKFQKLDQKYRTLKEQIASQYESSWHSMAETWREGMRNTAAEIESVRRDVAVYCPRWDDPAYF